MGVSGEEGWKGKWRAGVWKRRDEGRRKDGSEGFD